MWNLSKDTVRRIFAQEPGIIRYYRPRSKYSAATRRFLFPNQC